MSKKSQKCYEAVFNFIQAKVFDMSGVKTFVTDFELAMRNALKKQYTNALFTACHFHYTQAVRRKMTQLPQLANYIKSNDAAKQIYHKILCLPLLPHNEIEPTLRLLVKDIEDIGGDDEFEDFLKYYERQWMRKEGPRKISVFGNEIRTTSSAEGNNRNLNAYCQKKGSFIWFVASIRNQEFMKYSELKSFVESGGLVGNKQKKEYKVNLMSFCFFLNKCFSC